MRTIRSLAATAALTLALAGPLSGATWTTQSAFFNVCNGNSLALCASVQLDVFHNGTVGMVTMTVSNLSPAQGAVFQQIGFLGGPGMFQGSNLMVNGTTPRGWGVTSALDRSVNFGVRALPANPGLTAAGGPTTFTFMIRGDFTDFNPGDLVLAIDGTEAPGIQATCITGENCGPVTHTPEPGTLLLLGTGMAGIAAVRKRRGAEVQTED